MDEDLEKVKRRTEKRLEQYNQADNGGPINDAIDHLGRIEGYPTQNLSKVNIDGLPLPIRILGYVLIGSMGLFFLVFIILWIIK